MDRKSRRPESRTETGAVVDKMKGRYVLKVEIGCNGVIKVYRR